MLWLPPRIKLRKIRHPWQRTYKDGKLARYSFSKIHERKEDLMSCLKIADGKPTKNIVIT